MTRTVPARPTDGEGPRRSSAERPSRDRCLDIVQAETTTSPLEVESKANCVGFAMAIRQPIFDTAREVVA